jgi:spore germination protein GerM
MTTAACGISTEDAAQLARGDDVPFGLTDIPRSTTTTTLRDIVAAEVDIYLLGPEGRLVVATRKVAETDPSAVVAVLLEGPTEDEAAFGVTTALIDEHLVRSVEVVGGVADVDLAESFADINGATQRAALAQLVYTLTGRPGVGRVSFTLGGQPVEVPRGDGTLTTGSVARDSYREVQPSP